MNLPACYRCGCQPCTCRDGITLYHADCRDVLPLLEKVDLVLTDPPYGLGIDYASYDDTEENLREIIGLLPRLLELGTVVAVTPGITNIAKWPQSDWVLIWHWSHTRSRGKWGFRQWQPIIVWGADPHKYKTDVLTGTKFEPRIKGHPCSKQLPLWKKIIQ